MERSKTSKLLQSSKLKSLLRHSAQFQTGCSKIGPITTRKNNSEKKNARNCRKMREIIAKNLRFLHAICIFSDALLKSVLTYSITEMYYYYQNITSYIIMSYLTANVSIQEITKKCIFKLIII